MMGASPLVPRYMADESALTELHLDSVLTALGNSQLSLMQNRGTGMGTSLDPFTQVEIGCGRVLNEWQLRSLYRGSWFIRRVVDTPPDDMTKAGVELTLHDNSNSKVSTAALQVYRDGGQNVNPYSRRMSCGEAFRKAMTWARLFGQAYAVMRVNGGENPEKPLTKVKSFEGLTVLDRHALGPVIGTVNPEHPEFYQVDRRDNVGGTEQTYNLGQRIHESRVLVFRGAAIHPYDIQMEGDGAYDSIVQQLYECFTRYYTAKDAIGKGLDSYSLFKVAINGLNSLLGAKGGVDAIRGYLNTVAQQMSMHRVLVHDSEAGKSEFQERSFTGVAENFQLFKDELTAAAYPLPHYKIWGSVDKAGLADSGGAESRAYAEQIKSLQFRDFGDNHRRLFHAIFESLGKVPKSWEVTYPSIYTPTPEEEGAIAKTNAETLTLLKRDGIITASQGYQVLATGQPLENVLEPLDDADVLTIVDEAEEAGPSAEEELAALLGGGEPAGAIAPGVEPVPEVAPAKAEGEVAGGEEAVAAEEELAGLMAEDEEPDLATLEQQTDSADELLEMLLGWRVDAPKGKAGKKGKRKEKPDCTTGRSCGMSCVARTKKCETDLTPAADIVAKAVATRDPFDPAVNPLPRQGGAGGGRGNNRDPFDPATNPVPQRRQPQPQDPFDPAVNPVPRQQPQPPAQPQNTGGQQSGGPRTPRPLPSGVAKSRINLGTSYDFSVGSNAVNMRIEKTDLDLGREVTFYINGSFEMSDLPTSQKNRMALTLAKTFRAETSSVPDGTIYQTAAYADDGAGDYRTKAYQSFGFGKPSESDEYMYGIVRNGKLEPIDEDEALRLSA